MRIRHMTLQQLRNVFLEPIGTPHGTSAVHLECPVGHLGYAARRGLCGCWLAQWTGSTSRLLVRVDQCEL